MYKLAAFALFLTTMLLAACTSSSNNGAAQAVEAYYQAIVNQDADQAMALSCAEWEPNARMDVDSFLSVKAQLKDFSCKQVGTDGKYTLVACTGEIAMSYNGEAQTLDLSTQTYQVVNQDGSWLFCGYH